MTNTMAAAPVSNGWTPVLNGDLYCSPRCGCRCKKAEYDLAHANAAELAHHLGEGWEPRVWENCGWYWEATKGECRIGPHIAAGREKDGKPSYMLMWNFEPISSDNKVPQIVLHGSNPGDLLGLAKQDARTFMARMEAQLRDIG